MTKIKIKTNRGANKRFKMTANGKVIHYKANKSHILTSKARKRKNRLKKSAAVHFVDAVNIKRLLPYL
ncbi:MAG: 50S ribosomal protein L35 [Deltaproteobacteria bacterium]|nr:50S ribosomal protein L35 [Deltaproteobacteria bacterium]